MTLKQTSIYTFLSSEDRAGLFAADDVISDLHNLLQLSPSMFKVCNAESWWIADVEKKYEYQFLDKSKKLWPDVENEAAGLAGPAYRFKNQPELIRDFATIFVAKNGRKMAEVFVCETAEEIFEDENEATRMMMLIIFRRDLPLGMPWNRSQTIEGNYPGEVKHYINTKFGEWGQDFLLDLLRWKKPDACVEGDAEGDTKKGDSAEVPPGETDNRTP